MKANSLDLARSHLAAISFCPSISTRRTVHVKGSVVSLCTCVSGASYSWTFIEFFCKSLNFALNYAVSGTQLSKRLVCLPDT